MSRVAESLLKALPDRVLLDNLSRFQSDYSIFEARPAAVVRPESAEEIRTVLQIARQQHTPVIPRAGGSNTGGSAIGEGIILLLDHPTLASLSVSSENRRIAAEAAVRHDALQRALGEKGLWLPSDPSSGPLSYIGGNIATRASGPHALRHGSIARYLTHITFMLTNGQVVSTTDDSSVPAALLKELDVITSELSEDSNVLRELRHHDGHKWASGYDLGALLDHREDLCAALPRLLCGSVGTLGIVLSAEFGAEVLPPERFAVQLGFTNEVDACHAALMLRDAAEAVEFLSRESLELLREYNDTLDDHESEALLVAEFRNNERGIALTRITEIARRFTLTGKPCMAYESTEIEAIWKARKSLLPTIRRVCSERNLTAPSIVNDVGVPPDRLPELLSAVRSIFAKHSITAAIYGHAGSGNLHLRPLLREPSAPFLFELATEVYKIVTALGGFITAEHGLGPLRAPFLKMEWSASARRYMHRVKLAFDPDLILNPGSAIDDGDDQSGWTLPVRM